LEADCLTPFKKLTELIPNQLYPIVKISIVNGKYGKNVVAELEDCKVSLPNRFTKVLTEEKLEVINKQTLKLKYLGKKNAYSMIEFVE